MATHFDEITINKLAAVTLTAGVSTIELTTDMPNYATNKLTYLGVDVDQSFTSVSIWCETKDIDLSLDTDTGNLIDVTAVPPAGDGVVVLEKLQRRTWKTGLIKRIRFAVVAGTAIVNITLFNE